MSLSIPEFWKLIVESELISGEEAGKLAENFLKSRSDGRMPTVDDLVKWLVGVRVSPYQAKILLAGRPGPFNYGDYQIYERIESGRLAGIFRALHLPTGHRVCLFFLSGPQIQDPAVMADLKQRTQATSRATRGHPHLFRCYHLVDEGAYKFIVVEDLQGKRVERQLATKGAMSAPDACRVIRQAALGLERLHSTGQVHNEIRPANLWIEPSGIVKCLMFPLASDPLAPEVSWGQPSNAGGKPPAEADYVAPEVIGGGAADARSDIYSLGCTLYHLLAGNPPFAGGDLKSKLNRHQHEKPPALHEVNSQVPAALAKVVNYMMAKDPELRYQQSGSVVEAIMPFIDPQSLNTQPSVSRRAQAYEAWLQEATGQATIPAPRAAAPAAKATPASAAKAAPAPTPMAAAAKPASQPTASPAPAVASPMVAAPSPMSAAAPMPAAAPVMAAPVQAAPMMAAPMMAMPIQAAPMMAQPAMMAAPMHAAPMMASPMQAAPMHSGPIQPGPSYPAAGHSAPAVGATISAPTRSYGRRRRKSSFGLVATILLVAGGAAGTWWYVNRDPNPKQGESPNKEKVVTPVVTPDAKITKVVSTDAKTSVKGNEPPAAALPVDDPRETIFALSDSQTAYVWNSTTSGKPLELRYLPPGAQAVIVLRPSAILKHPEGERLVDPKVLGAVGEWFRTGLATTVGAPLEKIEQVTISLLDNGVNPPLAAYAVRVADPIVMESQVAAWGNPEQKMAGDKFYYAKGETAYFLPPTDNRLLVVGPEAALRDTFATTGESVIAPAIETLVKSSDSDRMLTVLFMPEFVLDKAKPTLLGPAAIAREPLTWLLDYDPAAQRPRAAMFSVHLDGAVAFAELRLNDPEAMPQVQPGATALLERVKESPDHVKAYIGTLRRSISDYSAPILFDNYPEMLKTAASYTRVGTSNKQIVARLCVPLYGVHNLALGAYLSMIENPASGFAGTAVTKPPTTTATDTSAGALGALKKVTSLQFDRNPFEVAVKLLGDDIGVPIILIGTDLQIEGITKNQSMALDEQNKPALDILKTILIKANPATEANPRGKLVYLIKKNAAGEEEIHITTRKAVGERKEKLSPDQEIPAVKK